MKKQNKIILGILAPIGVLAIAGVGLGIGYAIWHNKKTTDEIKPSLSFEKGGNNELSSIGDTITLNASFNQKVWWAGILLTSGCEDIFQDDYVTYSNDGGQTWRTSANEYDNGDNGVYFWFNSYNTSGSIIFKLLKQYTDDKLVNFTLAYCPKENEPAIESDESAPVLFLKNKDSNAETIKDINFHLFDNKTVISKTDFLDELTKQLGRFFPSLPLSSVPANCEQATNCLCKNINSGGISNAASIAALIACENYSVLSSKDPAIWQNYYDPKVTFDLEISFIHKNNDNDHFAFDFSQHWKKDGADQAELGGESFIWNYRYTGVDEKFASQNPTTQAFGNTYLSVDKTIRNSTGGLDSNDSNRGTSLDLITQDLAKTIYPGVNNFPTWMFPNP